MTCNKMSFTSKSEANKYIKTTNPRVKKSPLSRQKGIYQRKILALMAYKCLACKKYHLTSMSKREQKKMNKNMKWKNDAHSKLKEIMSMKSLKAKWAWLLENQDESMTLHDNGRVYLVFDAINARVIMD